MEVTESMAAAEHRVNASKEDIVREQKTQIASLENAVLNFTRDPAYADIGKEFAKMGNETQTPESILATIKMHFDKIQKQENEAAGEELRQVGNLAVYKLSELKNELTLAAGKEERASRQFGETMTAMKGDKPISEDKEVPENMKLLEEMLGEKPREKLENAMDVNHDLLSVLKRPENSLKFIQARVAYASISKGLNLDDAIAELGKHFNTGLNRIKSMKDAMKAKGALQELLKTQLDANGGLFNLLSEALISKPQHEEHEAEHESGDISDEEMAAVLQVLLEKMGTRIPKDTGEYRAPASVPDAVEAYTRVLPAYVYTRNAMTGAHSQEVSTATGFELGALQGGVNALVFAFNLGYGIGSYFQEQPKERKENKADSLMARIYEFGRGLLKTETWKKLGAIVSYGIENTSSAEKIFILNEMVAEIGLTITAGTAVTENVAEFLKSENLGAVAAKMTKLAKLPKIRDALRVSEYVAAGCAALGEFGIDAATISRRLGVFGEDAMELWDSTIKLLHKAHEIHHTGETVYAKTAEEGLVATDELTRKMKSTPAYKQLEKAKNDTALLLKNAKELKLTEAQVLKISKLYQELNKRLSP